MSSKCHLESNTDTAFGILSQTLKRKVHLPVGYPYYTIEFLAVNTKLPEMASTDFTA